MPDDSLLSQHLDEYRLEALLGQGGMAQIYRGFDIRLKRWAAIKVIEASLRSEAEYIKRFEREAQAIAQLKHPHIVGVYRYGEVNGLFYIAMEYIEGTDLEALLATYQAQQQTMPPVEASRIIRQVGLALDYAHSQEVIHRDVKPSNIMLDQQGNAILTDFGLVLLDHQTQGQIFGTPHYIAPEQAISSAGARPQSDLYALGVILYEMFTGQLPFEAAHPHDIALLHLTEPPPPPRLVKPDLSPELEAVILKALAKEPEERYASGAALADALDQALRLSPGSVVSPPLASPQRIAQAEPDIKAGQSLLPMPAMAAPASHLPVKKGNLMTTRYILKNIRALLTELTEGLSVAELRHLYFDLPDFRPVHQQLAHSSGKAEIIDRLLEYAEQTLQIDELLGLAKEHNPIIYDQHQPYYELAGLGRANLAGRNLGKYHLIARLGQGGMADVYKAYQPGLARYVAIKLIHGHLADNEEFIERFEGEAMAVAGLRHPNIVQVFDFDRDEELYYMVMELIDGPTLEAELKERRAKEQLFPLVETARIFQALASAIDYAHGRGVIHRDLKPGNIMFTPRKRVVLTDFGIARITSMPSYTTTHAIVGTPAYMSPEQAQGERIDQQSDIYSLGVILYEIVTGRLPFEGDNPVAIVLKLVSDSWPLPRTLNPDLPAGVEQVIRKAMSQDPAGRYPLAGEMAQALQAAIEEVSEPGAEAAPVVGTASAETSQPKQLELGRPKVDPLQPAKPAEIEVRPPSGRGTEAAQREPGQPGSVITISNNSGQVVFGGEQIVQVESISGGQVLIGPDQPSASLPQLAHSQTEVDVATLRQLLVNLKTQMETETSAEKRAAALERITELEAALTAQAPDLATIEYVQSWFARNVSALAGAVTELIAQPAMSRLMAAAGDQVVAEFRRRFGRELGNRK